MAQNIFSYEFTFFNLERVSFEKRKQDRREQLDQGIKILRAAEGDQDRLEIFL